MSLADRADVAAVRELSTEPATSRAWWFLGTLAVLRNPQGAPRIPAVIELTVPPGGSPPRHLHDKLDDAFLLLDGEVVVRSGEETVVAQPGTYVVVPHGVEHTFRVLSKTPAKLLLVHDDDSFLRFIESVGTPTTELRVPPPGEFDVDIDTIVRISAEHGAPIVGPSLEEQDTRDHRDPTPAQPTFGGVHHLSLHVADVCKSETWYSDVFGFMRVDGELAEDGTGHIVMLHPASGSLLTLASGEHARVEHVAFACPNRGALDGWHTTLTQRDLNPGTITEAPYGCGFVLRDPDGLEMELFAPTA